MTHYDYIVIGSGITGSALSYELAQEGFKVLLLEKDAIPNNATFYSYGGLAYWSGTTELTRQLCQEGIQIHRQLSTQLEADTEFREIDLILTIDATDNPQIIAQNYSQFAILPELLDIQEACQLEPLLNPYAISGALKLSHGHIHPQKTNQAYQKAFLRLGGTLKIESVIELLRQDNHIQGVATKQQNYYASGVIVCAGGLSRSLLKEAGIPVKLYYTHAQVIITQPVDIQLKTLVMPAVQKRLLIEAEVSHRDKEEMWNSSNSDLIASILEPGAIQFLDKSIRFGQISEIYPNPIANIEGIISEKKIRAAVGNFLPALKNLPGTWHHCLVAFANNSHLLIGEINGFTGVYLFSGFTSTLIFAPPLARRFARRLKGVRD